MATVDPIKVAQCLIRCPSVTPQEAGTLKITQETLTLLGFTCHRLRFGHAEQGVENLYARLGSRRPHFCFAGHIDVVPPGDRTLWTVDPFGGLILDGRLFGRGAVDMKGAVAAFLGGIDRFLQNHGPPPGSISMILTSDEEGPAKYGTVKVLEWLTQREEIPDACLVGEPTNQHVLGDSIKLGRRGSVNAVLRLDGRQGHTAYPHLADNPLPKLVRILHYLTTHPLNHATDYFPPSQLTLTSIDTANTTENISPAKSEARFNIRFNPCSTKDSLIAWLRKHIDAVTPHYTLDISVSAEAFLTPPGPLCDMLSTVVEQKLGRRPKLTTSGGTSDARFIYQYCPVVEFGLVGTTMHHCDENVLVEDITCLADIYAALLHDYFFHQATISSPSA